MAKSVLTELGLSADAEDAIRSFAQSSGLSESEAVEYILRREAQGLEPAPSRATRTRVKARRRSGAVMRIRAPDFEM